ncbi:MAG: hypothetical protein R3F62_24820 [Planctomycetota bacterium]
MNSPGRLHPLGFVLLRAQPRARARALSGVEAGTLARWCRSRPWSSRQRAELLRGCTSEGEAIPDDAPRDTGAPCCLPAGAPTAPLALLLVSPRPHARPDPDSVTCDLAPAPRVEPLLPSYTSAPPEGVFHPPRR